MKKYNVILLVMTLFLSSCKKSEPKQDLVLDLYTDIHIINKNGENLLAPSNSNSINKNNIKIYYLINGKKTEVFNTQLDYPRQYMIYQVEAHSSSYPGEYLMRVYLNKDGLEKKEGIKETITYIEFNNTQTDTLVAQLHQYGSSVLTEKISYNGDVKWDITSIPKIEDNSFPGRFFKVVK